MRIEVEIDGRTYPLEVVLEQGYVALGVARYPVKVLRNEGDRVELELAGEKVTIEGWAAKSELPGPKLSVNGEVVQLVRLLRGASTASSPPPTLPTAASHEGPGIAVRPPMPGKVLEVLVHNGDKVAAGQVVAVLEAMKMRNEIAAPTNGVVAELSVEPGSSVRAGDVLLRVVPG
jgi:biotin carboxyl carrier protein